MDGLPLLEDAYRFERELGRGGFGVVYLGEDGAGQRAALKVHDRQPDEAVRARVEREAKLLEGIRHPRLAGFMGAYRTAENHLALVYEYVEGRPLNEVVEAGRPEVGEALGWVSDLASALDALHAAGLVHRDVKPENVMITPAGRATLLDFGLARPEESGETVTATGSILGTPLYMSPEQLTGRRATSATDTYALACLTYELLSGRPPFEGNPLEVAEGHMTQRPAPLHGVRPDLPAALSKALGRGLEKEAGLRPESTGRFAEELRLGLEQKPGRTSSKRTVYLAPEGDDLASTAVDRDEREPPSPSRTVPAVLGLVVLLAAGTWITTRETPALVPPASAPPTVEARAPKRRLPELARRRFAWVSRPEVHGETGIVQLPRLVGEKLLAFTEHGSILEILPFSPTEVREHPARHGELLVHDSGLMVPARDGTAWLLAILGKDADHKQGSGLFRLIPEDPPRLEQVPWEGPDYIDVAPFPPSNDGRFHAAVCRRRRGDPHADLVISVDGEKPVIAAVELLSGANAQDMVPFRFGDGWVVGIDAAGFDPGRNETTFLAAGIRADGRAFFTWKNWNEYQGPPVPAWGGLVFPFRKHLRLLAGRHLEVNGDEAPGKMAPLKPDDLSASIRWKPRSGTLIVSPHGLDLIQRPRFFTSMKIQTANATWDRFSLDDPRVERRSARISMLSHSIQLGEATFSPPVVTPDGRLAAIGFENDAQQAAVAILDLRAQRVLESALVLDEHGISGGKFRGAPGLVDMRERGGYLFYAYVTGALDRGNPLRIRPQYLVEWYIPMEGPGGG